MNGAIGEPQVKRTAWGLLTFGGEGFVAGAGGVAGAVDFDDRDADAGGGQGVDGVAGGAGEADGACGGVFFEACGAGFGEDLEPGGGGTQGRGGLGGEGAAAPAHETAADADGLGGAGGFEEGFGEEAGGGFGEFPFDGGGIAVAIGARGRDFVVEEEGCGRFVFLVPLEGPEGESFDGLSDLGDIGVGEIGAGIEVGDHLIDAARTGAGIIFASGSVPAGWRVRRLAFQSKASRSLARRSSGRKGLFM